MLTQLNDIEELKTIKNESMEAYRRYLEDPTVDYSIFVERESQSVRRHLREKARLLALKRIESDEA